MTNNTPPSCANFFDQFKSLPVWDMDEKFFISSDPKTGKELSRIARPVDENNVPIQVLTRFKAWTKVDFIIDRDNCSSEVYGLTKQTATKSKRLLPAGSLVEIRITPSGCVWYDGFSIRIDHPGQDNLKSSLPIDFFSITAPVVVSKVPLKRKKL